MKTIKIIVFLGLIFHSGFAQNSNSGLTRTFNEGVITELGSVVPSEYGFFRVSSFGLNISYGRKHLVFYDYSTHNLYEMVLSGLEDPEVLEVNEIGNGKGSGPGEFRNPTDLCITKTGNQSLVILADPELSRITLWDLDSKRIIHSFNPKIMPFRISCGNKKITVFNDSQSQGGGFGIYDLRGNLLGQFENVNKSPHNGNIFVNSGYIVQNESDIYYAGEGNISIVKVGIKNLRSSHQNSIVESRSFKNDVVIETPDKNTVKTKRGDKYIYMSRDAGIIDQYLVVLHSGRTDAWGDIIDFYDTSDLSYKFSVMLPEFAQDMYVTENIIIVEAFDSNAKERYLKLFKISTDQF